MAVEINISDIINITVNCLNSFKSKFGENIIIEEDEYYETTEKRYFLGEDKLQIGSIKDDWNFISSSIKQDHESIAYMLIHVAPIIRIIAEKSANP